MACMFPVNQIYVDMFATRHSDRNGIITPWTFRICSHTSKPNCDVCLKVLSKLVVYEPLDDIGTLIPFEVFLEDVHAGGYMDYDGNGVYAIKDRMTNIVASPSAIYSGLYPTNFPFIMWYNK